MVDSHYVVTVIEARTGRMRRMVIEERNLSTGTEFRMDGGFPRMEDRDRFETLASNVTDTVLNLTENPSEVSIQDVGSRRY